MLAPIVLFVYNRPWHTRQTVEALQRCELAAESDLYIFADGPKEDATKEVMEKINDVRCYVHSINGFHSITIEESDTNKGLANSVISGVSKIIEKIGKAIVLEDDILTHPFFLHFMNEALDFYQKDKRIYCIGAFMDNITIPQKYSHDVFVCQRIETWGWATWADRWRQTDWNTSNYAILKHPTKKKIRELCQGGDDLWPLLQMQAAGKVDSWAARWQYSLTLANAYCLRSVKTLVKNIGLDGSGTNCGNISENNITLPPNTISFYESNYSLSTPLYSHPYYNIQMVGGIEEDSALIANLQSHFARPSNYPKLWKYAKRCINQILNHIKNNP